MRKDREQANVLRKSGMSYSEISARMSVPRSTLSSWFHKEKWSNDIALECVAKAGKGSSMRVMVLNTVRGNRLRKVYEDAKQDAFVDFTELKYHPLFIAGIMNYWAHGDKTSRCRVSVSSTDPKIIKIFLFFIENICGQNKYKARLLLHAGQDEQQLKVFWIEKTGLKYEQFSKISRIYAKTSVKSHRSHSNQGVCNIGLSSAYLKSKILKWIELMIGELCEEKYRL